MSFITTTALLTAFLCSPVLSSPAPRLPAGHIVPAPQITAAPVVPSKTTNINRRDIISNLEGDITSILGGLGSGLPDWVASGVEPYFQGLPTGDAVLSSLGIQSSDLAAVPTNVLNLPPYANWTDAGWNVRFHGNVYKQPNTSVTDLNRLGSIFINGSVTDYNATQQDMIRNLTAEIFVVQQGNVTVAPFHLDPAMGTTGGTQDVTLAYNTTVEGDYDVFTPIMSNGLLAGNATNVIQHLNIHVAGAPLGNATAYLVPPTGITFISDIDDILRMTKIYEPKLGLLNSFADPFVQWQDMPSVYANWSATIPNAHFHYLTTTPEEVTRNYMDFIYKTYPLGSFDTRPLNFSNVAATLSIRKFLLDKIFQTFPQRKFVLIADTSNSDVMKDYPLMATTYPNQLQCIFLRNTSASDSGDKFPYDTSGFKSLNQSQYMFFVNADDLMNLDVANGQCYNKSIAQNVTFGYQGLPFSSTSAVNASATHTASAAGRIEAGAWRGVSVVGIAAIVTGFGLLW